MKTSILKILKFQLVGWGQTENKDESSILLAALLPYINYKNCRQMVSEDFANSIATDKFCAGSAKGLCIREITFMCTWILWRLFM